MDFLILGPLEVADGERAIALDAAKERALLGVLLLHANEVVSTERLIDELWGERPPATAAKLVQTYVSHLRKALGPEAVVTRAPGYLLPVDGDLLDAVRFRRLTVAAHSLASDGGYERAASLYDEALALWRGPALADVSFESFARNQVERLEEERLEALMGRIDCELALGREDRVVGELEGLVEQHPFRERLWAQLMLALYRSGRQAEALAAYREARRTLVDELGLDPGPELQELEKAILGHDAALQAPKRPAPARVRSRRRWALAAVAATLVLAVALGAALPRAGNRADPLQLASNSVGFIDAESGQVKKSCPVGRGPHALAVAFDSLWVANFTERTVTRFNRRCGEETTFALDGHPTGLARRGSVLWAWTREGLLIPIDPRFDSAGDPIPVAGALPGGNAIEGETFGGIAVGGGFVWVTDPAITVIRVDPSKPRDLLSIIPDAGAHGPIEFHEGAAWVAGADEVFPIPARWGKPKAGIKVGAPVRGLTFFGGSPWVVSGAPHRRTRPALRGIDLRTRLVDAKITVGNDPIAVAAAGGFLWVASRSDAAVYRVQRAKDQDDVVKIPLGARPTALVADANGVWVAVE